MRFKAVFESANMVCTPYKVSQIILRKPFFLVNVVTIEAKSGESQLIIRLMTDSITTYFPLQRIFLMVRNEVRFNDFKFTKHFRNCSDSIKGHSSVFCIIMEII